MINLLPATDKAEIRAGRINRLLLRYIILFTILMVALFAVLAFAYVSLSISRTDASQKLAQSSASANSLSNDKKRLDSYLSDVAIAKQILDKQVNYSSILLKVASVIPPGVVIDQLTLNPQEFGKPVTITAHAKNDAAALALKDRMNNSTYFQNSQFESLATGSGTYPITVTMNVIFTQELLK